MLETILLEEEYLKVPQNVVSKIEKFLNDSSEQYLNLKAFFETYKSEHGQKLNEIQHQLTYEIEKRERVQLDFDKKCEELVGLQKKTDSLEKQNLRLKEDVLCHENEARTYRLQRDEIADEKSSLEAILNRRTNELDNLKLDYDSLNEKFKLAVQARIEALTELDGIQSKKIELDFKEKRLEKEKELLNEQINLLSNDVSKHGKELVNLRREHNSQILSLQTDIQQKNEEIRVLLQNEENYRKNIQELTDKIEELNNRLTGQSEVENQLQKKYLDEIESRSKLADVYKNMSEESNKKAEELAKTARDLQKLLNEASIQYEDLEKRFTINETTYKEHLQQKNDTIAALKKELLDSNNLIEVLKQNHLSDTLESLSPHAAAAYNMMKKGLTLTQIYTEYASVSEQLMIKTHDNEQLQKTFKSFIEELEGKAHIIRKRNEDYAEAMATIDRISQSYNELEMEHNVMKEKYTDAERNHARLVRDNERLQKTVSDLSRQVCFLLKEVEESRGGEILIKTDADTSDCFNSSDIISKRLVTFHDIQELQEHNKTLLATIRDLSEEFENAEIRLKATNKEELENKVKSLENELAEKEQIYSRQEKIIRMLKDQVKMYKMINNDRSYASRSFNDDSFMSIDVSMIESGPTKVASCQTNCSEMESIFCSELQKELDSKKKELSDLKTEFEACTKEHSINEKMMLESLEKAEKNYNKLSHEYKALLSRADSSEEKCKCLKLTTNSLKAEIAALENKCKTYSQTMAKHEQTIELLRDEAMTAVSKLSRNEILLENVKREFALSKESEARIAAERDVLKQDKQNHAYLLSNIEFIKASIERSESEWKLKMEEKWNTAEKECSALRRRLQEEQDRFNEKINFLEQSVESAKNRLEEEKKSNMDLINMINSLKEDLNEKNRVIEELKNKLKISSSENIAELELLLKNLQNKYQQALKEVAHQKELAENAKKDAAEITKLSENFENILLSERESHLQYKKETEAKILELSNELTNLQKQNANLQKRVQELSNLNKTSVINLNDELLEEKRKNSSIIEEVDHLRKQLTELKNELQAANDAKLVAEKKYADEMLKHTEDLRDLKKQIDVVMTLKNKIAELTNERDTALLKAESNNNNRLEQEKRVKQEMDEQNARMKDLIQQNELLLNQIQEVSLKIAIKQSQAGSGDEKNSSILSDDGGDRGTDNLLQVISYLKREKNLATSQLETLMSENRRLKSEIELMKRQFEETRALLQAEQEKTDITTTTAAKHAELINKVQNLNALNDSNRVLREEKDKLVSELTEIKEKLEKIESQTVHPLRNENKQLNSQLETLQTENVGLQKECTRWRTRITEMTVNKNNSEDILKSLNVEREAHNKTLDDLRAVKQEKSKLEDQVKKLQSLHSRVASLEKDKADTLKERNELQKDLEEEKAKNTKITQDFEELQKTLAAHEFMINELKNSNTQVRSIARKYKSKCQELTNQVEQLKNKPSEAQLEPSDTTVAPLAEISVVEQDRLRQEGRQQVENEMNDRIKDLNEQLTVNKSEIDRLLLENKSLQKTVSEKEVRATDILKQARTRIVSLSKESKKHQIEAESYKERLKHIENATREEGIARQNVMKSTYENRISKLEKEKTENQTDRDRLNREVEILSQRVTALQRQLHNQTGVKSTVNSGQDKGSVEPPTANIKPMAGPSSSVAKSQQSQQSVAVTPWRSANETPLASIRPMSMQTRTAAVLPTSQTSCSSASQSTVVVPPQQQHVDTSSNAPSIVEAFSSSPSSSSHTDYNMPSTSSSVSHTSVRQVVVTPTQQTSHSAESTQDMEVECGNQELQSQISLSSQQASQVSQNQATGISTLSSIMAAPTVSQSQTPTVALVLPRIDLQNLSTSGTMHLSNIPEQSIVASSQTTPASLVSASNQTDSSNTTKRTETYYQQDGEDSNSGHVSASSQHSQQQAVVASSIETAPEQSIVIASSQQSSDKNMSEPSVASSNANSSNTVTTTQAGLKRVRETEGEGSKSSSSSSSSSSAEINSVQPQVKRSRRMEPVHEDIFRSDIDEASNTDMLLRYGGIDVEYQVPTSSQRDQEFDNLVIDSEGDDELEEDEQAMPDDGIIDENDDVQEYVEDEDEVESEEVYEMESYDREEQDTPMNRYTALEGPDIDEENVQVHDQDNEVEITDEESNEVPNQSGRSDSTAIMNTRRNLEQQSSEATSSGNNMRAQSASISSNQSPISLQFSRRPSSISPLNRQQNQQLLISQGFEDNAGDDSIVPSTPTLCVPRRTDGFGEAVSSPHVPSGGRFTFSESNPPTSRAGVAQMVSEGIDDTRMDLSQLEENTSTGRSVPSTPLQSSPQDIERIEVGQSVEDSQPLNEDLSSNTSGQQPQPTEDILLENVAYSGEVIDNELEVIVESENLIDEPPNQENNDGVTSESNQSDPQIAETSQNTRDDLEEGREAEAATKTNDPQSTPQQIPITTGGTARRSGSRGRQRNSRVSAWESSSMGNAQDSMSSRDRSSNRGRNNNQRSVYRRANRRQRSWNYGGRY